MKRFFKVLAVAAALLVGAGVIGIAVLRSADGPTGPLQGGELRTGSLVADAEVDWHAVVGDAAVASIELQLVEPTGSRITGAFVHEGELYVPCDLGFIWRRVPDDTSRRMLHLIWLLKDWHENALVDGRAVVRFDGRRYERQAVRVSDPQLLALLRTRVESAAVEFFGELLPVEAESEAIWFFRMDPR